MRRRGMTLIEVLVVIGSSVVILGLIAGTIRTMARAEHATENHLVQGEVLAQLSESFRSHVHAARPAELIEQEQGEQLKLALVGSEVEFRVQEHRVLRVVRSADGSLRQERYSLPPGSTVRFEIDRGHEPTTVTLVVARHPAGAPTGTPRELRVEAVLGRDHRHSSKGN